MVPDVIDKSWRRSQLSGVDPNRLAPKFGEVNTDTILVRTAKEVLGPAVQNLADTNMSMGLTDASGHIVWRWADNSKILGLLDMHSVDIGFDFTEEYVGTNGAGTVLETGRAVMIRGGQHFAESLKGFACFAAPIIHPITGRRVGALSISCEANQETPLMRAMGLQLAKAITEALLHRQSVSDRQLLDRFTHVSKTRRGPVLAVNQDLLICDSRAAGLGIDHEILWAHVRDLTAETTVVMPVSGDLLARCELMTHRGKVTGSILTVQVLPAERVRSSTSRPPQLDWTGLVAAASNIARSNGRLLVHGEPATGKLALIEQAVKIADADTFDVLDHLAEGPDWLARLEFRVREVPASIAVKHLDQVPATAITALDGLIHDALDQGTVVCSTTGTLVPSDRDSSPLHEVFDQAELELPPLRQRRSTIVDDVERISRSLFPEGHRPFTADALSALVGAVWVENYRQLHEVISQVADGAQHGGQPIELSDLPEEFQNRQRRLTPIEEAEVVAILRELRRTGGNKKEAAARLGISRGSLYTKIKTYRISGKY